MSIPVPRLTKLNLSLLLSDNPFQITFAAKSDVKWIQKRLLWHNYCVNIYLDIDGVILANDEQAANYAPEFIAYVLTNYPESTYWLTTHCNGDASVPIKHIGHLFDDKTVTYMRMVKPTSWDMTAKTDAIDFDQPFLWFDDDLFYAEKQTLIQHDTLDNWIKVDLSKDPNHLAKFIASFPIPV